MPLKQKTAKELAKMSDAEIDYSDIPELPAEFWENAEVVFPEVKEKQLISIRLDREILAYFKAEGKGYQTRINTVLKTYIDAQRRRRKVLAQKASNG